MQYDYKLSDSQLQIANEFAEAYEKLGKAGVSILWEHETGTLLLVNNDGFEFTGEVGYDYSIELRSGDIETDSIVCLTDERVNDLYDAIFLSPKVVL